MKWIDLEGDQNYKIFDSELERDNAVADLWNTHRIVADRYIVTTGVSYDRDEIVDVLLGNKPIPEDNP